MNLDNFKEDVLSGEIEIGGQELRTTIFPEKEGYSHDVYLKDEATGAVIIWEVPDYSAAN